MRHRFVHEMQVRFADTDAQGHMFFANYFTFCDEALTAYMRAIGCPWQELVASGVDMFYASARCDYRGAATFEARLAVHARVARIGNTSLESEYAVYAPDGALIASAALVSVCVDPATRQPTRVPDRIRDAVAAYEPG
jgi:acyl-CoA thioester hydrolase